MHHPKQNGVRGLRGLYQQRYHRHQFQRCPRYLKHRHKKVPPPAPKAAAAVAAVPPPKADPPIFYPGAMREAYDSLFRTSSLGPFGPPNVPKSTPAEGVVEDTLNTVSKHMGVTPQDATYLSRRQHFEYGLQLGMMLASWECGTPRFLAPRELTPGVPAVPKAKTLPQGLRPAFEPPTLEEE